MSQTPSSNAYHTKKALYLRLKRCMHCGKINKKNTTKCSKCVRQSDALLLKKYHERKTQGKCTTAHCENPINGKRKCESCLQKIRDYMKEYRQRHKS